MGGLSGIAVRGCMNCRGVPRLYSVARFFASKTVTRTFFIGVFLLRLRSTGRNGGTRTGSCSFLPLLRSPTCPSSPIGVLLAICRDAEMLYNIRH